ncbi:transposase [Azospirillum sp. YIM B02556]|uniref:Transposase n=1 Tax=Azospirillum endophyticum TaxID=2800326 RepID=A0ABS1F6G9_9PROT|nr:transposase [Azospirillum endophyticum]
MPPYSGYAVNRHGSKPIEQVFGWIKTVAGHRKSRFRGIPRAGWAFPFATAAFNLIRLSKLEEATP